MVSVESQRFEIVGKLGEGGMGVVYEAHDRHRDMRVALKKLRRLDPASLYRFKREFRAVSDLSHPNIVALYELVSEGDDLLLTMELVRGLDLIRWVARPPAARPRPPTPPFTVPDDAAAADAARPTGSTITSRMLELGGGDDSGAFELVEETPRARFEDLVDGDRLVSSFRQLAEALAALHANGIVHRDVKPSNVRVDAGGRVVLMDFGIAAEGGERGPGRALGTPSYMAPEQAAGARPSAAADWYAFGTMLYLALTGRLPYRGRRKEVLRAKQRRDPEPPGAYAGGIPPALARLALELLSRDPDSRPRAAEVLAALGSDANSSTEITGDVTSDPFVGRERELEALRDTYRAVRTGATAAVIVEGESGMGKTSLVRRFLRELGSEPTPRRPLVLHGRCHERESLSYKAFDGVIDSLSRALLDLPGHTVARSLPRDIDLLTRLFPVLRQVPGIRAARALAEVGPRELRRRAIDALRTLLDNLGTRRALVISIDDLQWADRDSLDLLLALTRPPAPKRVLLVASLRTENLDGAAPIAEALDLLQDRIRCHQFVLGPLSGEERAELVADLGIDPEAAARFGAETGGSPLMIVELARYLAEAIGDPRAADSPTLDDVIRRRVAHLDGDARRLLEVVAVAGEPLPVPVIAEAAGVDAEERERAAAALRAGNIVRVARADPEAWLVAHHDRIRETVAMDLGDARREVHGRIARALEDWGGATVDVLARHWREAGDHELGARYLERAAAAAADKLAFDRAAELYRAAMELSGDIGAPALRRLADQLVLAGRLYEAAETYERAATLAPEAEVLELERLAADNLLRCGRIDRGRAMFARVMDALGMPLPRTRRRAALSLVAQRLRLLVRGRRYRARPASRIRAVDRARLDAMYGAAGSLGMLDHILGAAIQTRHLIEALDLGDEWRVCRALGLECAFLSAPGGRATRRARALGREVLLQARRQGDPYLTGVAKLSIGGMSFFAGRVRQAAGALEECDRLLSGTPVASHWEKVTARYFLALARIAGGDLAGNAAIATRALEEAERSRDIYARAMFGSIPNTTRLLVGDRPDEAARALDGVLAGWPDDVAYIATYVRDFARALVDLYRGDGAAAAERVAAIRGYVRELMLHRIPWILAEIETLDARAAVLEGDHRHARRLARAIERSKIPFMTGVASSLRAAAARAAGDVIAAQEHLGDAVTRFEDASAAHLAAACRCRLGAALDTAEGRRLHAEGLAWLEGAGVAAPRRYLDFLVPGLD